jgi:CBS domain-containing protein
MPLETPSGGAAAAHDRARDALKPVTSFLARHEPFRDLDTGKREWVAASIVERLVPAHQVVLAEGGAPATELFIVRDGTVELLRGDLVVDVLRSGEAFGHSTLLTGHAPQYTARAFEDTTLFVVPGDVALDILSRPAGLAFVAETLGERYSRTAWAAEPLAQARTATVSALVQRQPPVCSPETTIREATRLMSDEVTTAVLVETRDGLGIVTNADLREKVVLGGVPTDAPVTSIMSAPVKAVRADALAADAAVEMMDAGVKHLAVVDAQGRAVGILSADSFMTLDAFSPLALRRSFAAARDVEGVVEIAGRLPAVFLGLIDARLEASAVTRVLTTLHDAMVTRLLELSIRQQGEPPTGFAWLALGSAARNEFTLASDQDNALAYVDSDDPAVGAYFEGFAQVVTAGLEACGFKADMSGVTASNPMWRLSASAWRRLFLECFRVPDESHLMGASIAFDFRRVAGEPAIVPPLLETMRTAPEHPAFLELLAGMVSDVPSPLGFRRRLTGPVDVKRSGLLPVENLARYYALSSGLTTSGTLDRLVEAGRLGHLSGESLTSLRAAYIAISDVRLQHHAELLRAGRRPDNAVDTALLPRLTHAILQEALRVVDGAKRLMPPPLHGWR